MSGPAVRRAFPPRASARLVPVVVALAVLRGRARLVVASLGPALLTLTLVTFMALMVPGLVLEPIGESMLFILGGGGDDESFQNSRS